MSVHDMHREDVKAAIRKRFGSIKDFAEAHNISVWGVHDFLRGRPNKRAARAIESMLIGQIDTPKAGTAHPKNLASTKDAA
jgi:lambda repressor-like predicted transcriptional regulator